MRDPRVEPRSGDVVRLNGTEYVIKSVRPCCKEHGKSVAFRAKRGRTTFGVPIDQWRNDCAGLPFTIIHAEGE